MYQNIQRASYVRQLCEAFHT